MWLNFCSVKATCSFPNRFSGRLTRLTDLTQCVLFILSMTGSPVAFSVTVSRQTRNYVANYCGFVPYRQISTNQFCERNSFFPSIDYGVPQKRTAFFARGKTYNSSLFCFGRSNDRAYVAGNTRKLRVAMGHKWVRSVQAYAIWSIKYNPNSSNETIAVSKCKKIAYESLK